MNLNTNQWDDYAELVTWAVWCVIKAITKGQPLEGVMHSIISTARTATFKEKKK